MQLLLMVLLKVTLVALIGRLVIAAMPRASASTRYLIATTTLCSMLLVPVAAVTGFEWKLPVLPAHAQKADVPEMEEPAPVEVVATALPPASLAMTAHTDAWQGWLLLAVVTVATLLFGRMLFGIAAVVWITQHADEVIDESLIRDFDRAAGQLGVTRFARLLTSDRVSVPLMWGITRPALLLPADAMHWTRDRLRVVFLHELAHLRRCDALTLLITRATTAAYWFHPLAWSLERIARRECEQACDDLVLATGTRASEYADHLLSIAADLPRHDPFASVTLAMSRRSQLEGRLLSILQSDARRGVVSRSMAIAALFVAALLVLPIATVRLTAQSATPQDTSVLDNIKQNLRKEVASTVTHTVTALASSLNNNQQPRHFEHADSRSGSEVFAEAKEAFSNEDYTLAIADYRKAVDLNYRPAVSMYNLACSYSKNGDNDDAIAWLGKAIDAGFDDRDHINSDSDFDPIRSDARFISLVSDKSGRYTNQYDSLRASGSHNAEAYAKVGAKLLNNRDLPQAIEALSEAIRLDPFLGNAWYNLGCAYALSGDSKRALDTVEQSLLHGFNGDGDKLLSDSDLDSIHGQRLDQLAKLADDLALQNDGDDWSDAIDRLNSVAHQHPNIARAWFNLGFAQCEGGEERGAIESFQRVLSMGYRPGTTMYNLGCAYSRMGDKQNAVSWLMKSAATGFNVGSYAKNDRDLDNVRDEPWVESQISAARGKGWEKDKDKEK